MEIAKRIHVSLFILVLLLTGEAVAQSGESVRRKPDNVYYNILKFTPAKLIAIVNPAIEFSYERRTGRRFSTSLMASYLLPTTILDMENDFKPEIKGFRVALEEKFYWRRSVPDGLYSALEFNFLKNQYKDIITLESISNPVSKYSDSVSIKKQTLSFNLKIGYEVKVRRLIFDFYTGIGLRYKDGRHYNRINPGDKMPNPIEPDFSYLTNLEGRRWTISVPLNARVGWVF